MTAHQLDLFERPHLVSRWNGDGPWEWHDSGCWAPHDPNARWFDGVGWCQGEVRWCDRCAVWHPVDFEWGGGGERFIADYRHTVQP